ncbi:hypothetical protein [Aliikangiella sp. G2MR2-5]|uniref:hypothetical protein n=1 Tax=Aliikangiella sp. G2MR2-5 TaxID=2788943 RepID=UPI0018A9AB7B|nr:hypothetical protein [Aliikangiella sp. G2MR2-5]
MQLKNIILVAVLYFFSSNVFSANQSKSSLKLGVAYDLDIGVSAQYKGYSFFVNGDAFAFDVRAQNFYNDNKSLHFYVDLGGFIENYDGNDTTRDDSAGVRAPIGMTFGIARDFQAYIQAVPNYDFSNEAGFDVDGAIGIRYRF